jgi:crossover junction endodeoxyribonuclease RusA
VRAAELQLDIEHHRYEDGVLTLCLPWPPSINDFKVPNRKVPGLYYLTRRAKQFREDVGWLCAGAYRFSADAEILIDVMLHPPDVRRRDVDNWQKSIFDALVHAQIFKDDCQIQSFRVTKAAVRSGGAVIVKIWERKHAVTVE